MGEAGFEPAKAEPDGLQPPSFDRLDTPPWRRILERPSTRQAPEQREGRLGDARIRFLEPGRHVAVAQASAATAAKTKPPTPSAARPSCRRPTRWSSRSTSRRST